MDFSEEWKSQWPISAAVAPPLLLSGPPAKLTLGPLAFNPIAHTQALLLSSPSLSPSLSPPPQLSLPRLLAVADSGDSYVPSSVASLLRPYPQNDAASTLLHNRLQLLQNGSRSVVVFFPTGENSDEVGFVVLCIADSSLRVWEKGGEVFKSGKKFRHQIIRILVNPLSDLGFGGRGNSSANTSIGYLLAYTRYSVHWFNVQVKEFNQTVNLVYLGCKVFKSSSIVNACWSPHLPEESVVLLENGQLFLFDLDSCSGTNFKGNRLRVSWNEMGSLENGKWLGCEFTWHPRVLVVAHSDSVFLVDLRFDVCKMSFIAKIEMLRTYAFGGKDQFIAFSKAGSDGFHFALATNSLLILCDVRKSLMPVLQWVHLVDKPCYIDVFRLSDLRSHSRIETYKWASKSGYGIILGSFWSREFSLFCYGPPVPAPRESVACKVSQFCKPLYAWELPSDLSLWGCEYRCGSCLLREEFSKDALPEWINWQQKKDLVLGFGILNKDLSALLSGPDEFGGFTLIRLMSSGKLELQKYCASWDLVKRLEETHKEPSFCIGDNFLYSMGEEEYKFPKRYKYMKLEYLCGYLNGNLAEVLYSNMKKASKGPQEKESFNLDFQEFLCEKLKDCGFDHLRSSPAISVVFNNFSLPTSIREVALRRMWTGLPMELLQLAFSSYSEFLEVLVDRKKVSLEFLVVPDTAQLPPFFLRKPSCRSNKWSHKVQRSDSLVGPVLPLPILLTLHEYRNGCSNSEEEAGFSPEAELTLQCNEVMQVASETAVSDSCSLASELHDDHAVSLADDREMAWNGSEKPKPFFLYRPVALNCSTVGHSQENSVYKDENFAYLISKVSEQRVSGSRMDTNGLELFDNLSPVDLNFEAPVVNFGPKELKAFNILKRQFSSWQEGFNSYQEFCTKSKL